MKDLSSLFSNLKDYRTYFDNNNFNEIPNLKLNDSLDITFEKKISENQYQTVDKDNKEPIPPELDDLIRLHFLVTSRKVTSILEFGVGYSTAVFDHALEINKMEYLDYCIEYLRRENLFECHSVDNSKEWINLTKRRGNYINTKFHFSACSTSTFNSRICTYYDKLPNVTPDLIYIDGPDQYNVQGDIRGISTKSASRLPMSADILAMEHFLHPGTLIVLDGRTGNARFIKANLQRDWEYYYSKDFDQHFFELREKPLGPYDMMRIKFCLGQDWIDNL